MLDCALYIRIVLEIGYSEVDHHVIVMPSFTGIFTFNN